MKNKRILIVLILTILLSILFASCRITNGNNNAPGNTADTATPAIASAEAPTDSPSSPVMPPETTRPPSPSPTPAASVEPASGFDFEEKTYSEGKITVKYPQITGMTDRAAEEKLNKIITDAALRDTKDLQSGTEYELNYKVTYNSPAVISMYFNGYINVPDTIHPSQFLRAVTIDVKKQETITLPTLLSISDDVVNVLFNGQYSSMGYDMTHEYQTSIKDNLTSLGTEFWVNELRNADTDGSSTSSYLTNDALVVSVSVPHVMGDHVEIHLGFKDLIGHQTDNPIWQEIEQ